MANNKLREALMQIYERVNSLDEDCAVDPVEIRDIAKAALAEPLRNCDAGTVQEQIRRWNEDCSKDRIACSSFMDCSECALRWAQMPYKKGGTE